MAIAAKHAMKLLIVLIALCGVASSQTLTLTANNVCRLTNYLAHI